MSACLIPCCRRSTDEDELNLQDILPDEEIPVKNRKKTDRVCFIIFVLCITILFINVVVAAVQGDLRRFFPGCDSKGNICGIKNVPIEGVNGTGLDLREKRFLQVKQHCYTCTLERKCVKECEDGYQSSIIPRCRISRGKHFQPFLERIIMDLSLCWREIVAVCICSVFLSGLVLKVLQLFAKIFIPIIIYIVSLGATAFTVFAHFMHNKNQSIKVGDIDVKLRDRIYNSIEFWEIAAYFATFFTIVFFLSLRFLWDKLKLVAVLFHEGGKCIADIPMMLFQPILTYLITAVFAILFYIGLICLETSGKAEMDDDGIVSYQINIWFEISSWLLFFMFLWLSQFFLACQNFVIAGAASSWYFSRDKSKVTNPLWDSICLVVRYHLGSAALGSLVLSLIKTCKWCGRTFLASDSEAAQVVYFLIRYLLFCIEVILKIISKTAYVMIVLSGKPLCRSVRLACSLITTDSSNVAILIGAQTFILVITEIFVIFTATLIGVVFMNIQGLEVYWNPLFAMFLISWLCCHCFFSVYSMTIDTLIICFCVDHQMNNGLEKPYFMSKDLMVFFNINDSSTNETPPV